MAQQLGDVSARCPYLGLKNDPDSFFSFPASENACHKLIRPETLDTTYQKNVCFGDYHTCPVYMQEELASNLPPEARRSSSRRSTLADALPPVDPNAPGRRRVFIIGSLIAAVAIIGIIAAGFIFLPGLIEQEPTPTTFQVAAQTASPTPEPATTTPTPAPPTATPTVTNTFVPTNTLPPTATPTPDGIFDTVELEFESFMREGPSTDFEEITLLPAGTTMSVLGRDLNGFWLLVQLADGREGWIKTTQFVGDPPVADYPLADDIPPTYTPEG